MKRSVSSVNRRARAKRFLSGFTLALAAAFCAVSCSNGSPSETQPGAATRSALSRGNAPAAGTGVPGVTSSQVLFGQSAAFTGPARELGSNMRLGILAAFQQINEAGGVNGRTLELVSLDDAYEPEAAIANTQYLMEQEQVFALIGAVGTPTSRSATPVAAEAGVPYIAPFTGAAFLRNPELANVVNLRASYIQETQEMVVRLREDLNITRIGVLYQDDSFGRAGYQGAKKALASYDMEPVSVGVYSRNTVAVKTALLDLRRGNPEAVILVGAYEPVAALIHWAKYTGLNAVFIAISFVGSNALAEELGPAGQGVFVTQVVPFPNDDTLPVIQDYHEALAAYNPAAAPGFVSLEGYLAGRLAAAAVESCGQEVTRECFLGRFSDTEGIDLSGFKFFFGPGDNQGSDKVFLTVIGEDGEYEPIFTLRQIK